MWHYQHRCTVPLLHCKTSVKLSYNLEDFVWFLTILSCKSGNNSHRSENLLEELVLPETFLLGCLPICNNSLGFLLTSGSDSAHLVVFGLGGILKRFEIWVFVHRILKHRFLSYFEKHLRKSIIFPPILFQHAEGNAGHPTPPEFCFGFLWPHSGCRTLPDSGRYARNIHSRSNLFRVVPQFSIVFVNTRQSRNANCRAAPYAGKASRQKRECQQS